MTVERSGGGRLGDDDLPGRDDEVPRQSASASPRISNDGLSGFVAVDGRAGIGLGGAAVVAGDQIGVDQIHLDGHRNSAMQGTAPRVEGAGDQIGVVDLHLDDRRSSAMQGTGPCVEDVEFSNHRPADPRALPGGAVGMRIGDLGAQGPCNGTSVAAHLSPSPPQVSCQNCAGNPYRCVSGTAGGSAPAHRRWTRRRTRLVSGQNQVLFRGTH